MMADDRAMMESRTATRYENRVELDGRDVSSVDEAVYQLALAELALRAANMELTGELPGNRPRREQESA